LATIYKRGRYYWIAFRNRNGQRIQESTGQTDKAAANILKKHYDRLEKSYPLSGTPLQNAIKFSEYLREYLELRKNRVAEKTITRDRQAMESLMNSAGDLFLTRIRAEHIEKWLSELLQTRKQATANCLLRHCKACFNYAVKLNYIRDNPTKEIKAIREPEKAIRILTQSEVTDILNTMPEAWQDLIRVALATGARAGELCRLEKKDVNIDEGYIVIRSTADNPTKNRKSRTVPIPDSSIDLFLKLLGIADRFLLTTENGSEWTVDHISKGFKRYSKKAKIVCTFHDLRRTYGGWLVMSGADLVTVQQNLGHSSITVTVRHYSQVLLTHRKEQVDKLPGV